MIQEFFDLYIETSGQKLYEFTSKSIEWIKVINLKMVFEFKCAAHKCIINCSREC